MFIKNFVILKLLVLNLIFIKTKNTVNLYFLINNKKQNLFIYSYKLRSTSVKIALPLLLF